MHKVKTRATERRNVFYVEKCEVSTLLRVKSGPYPVPYVRSCRRSGSGFHKSQSGSKSVVIPYYFEVYDYLWCLVRI